MSEALGANRAIRPAGAFVAGVVCTLVVVGLLIAGYVTAGVYIPHGPLGTSSNPLHPHNRAEIASLPVGAWYIDPYARALYYRSGTGLGPGG